MKTPHKHAAVLRAIADGMPFDRIEISIHGQSWGAYEKHHEMYLVGSYVESAEFRIKPAETVRYVNVYPDIVGAYKNTRIAADEDTRSASRFGVIKITTRDDGTFDVEKI